VGSDKNLHNLLTSRFNDLPLRIQVISIGTFSGKIPSEDINYSIKAIEMRNKAVHDGWEPTSPNDVKTALGGLIRLVRSLLPDPGFKFPSAKQGNRRMSIEDWEKEP
jgi:hypothetical protein